MTPTPSRALRVAAVVAMLIAGALLAVQSQINGRLAAEIGGGTSAGLAAAVVSFGTGLVAVALVTLGVRRHRAGIGKLVESIRSGRLHPAALLAGLFGAFLVASQGLTVATIGVALFSVALTAGQSASGLLVDHVGLGPGGHRALSVPRAIAASFAVTAVVLATGERLLSEFGWQTALFAMLPLLAGAGSSVQAALNGRISHHGGPWVATLTNFTVGFLGLCAVFAVSLLGDPSLRGLPGEWWLYLGGVMGVTFIWLASALVRVHGVLVLGLCLIAGHVIGAEVIELVISEKTHVGPVGVAAGALTVLGVLVALLVKPKARGAAERVGVVQGPAD